MKKQEKITRLQVIILSLLKKHNATSMATGISVYELQKYCALDQAYITLYKNIQKHMKMGYIAEGLQDGKCFTYYATKDGIKFLEEMM